MKVLIVLGGITVLAFLAPAAAFIFLLVFSDDLIRVDGAHPTRAEAEADNVFTRGEMPRDMPATMNEIEIRTHVEFNYVWATFRTDDEGVRTIRTNYPEVSSDQIKLPIRPGVRWWPRNLRPQSKLYAAEYEFYRCGDRIEFQGTAFLALDPETHQVYYWLR